MIPLRRAIALLEVSVSGYYKWLISDKEHNGVDPLLEILNIRKTAIVSIVKK